MARIVKAETRLKNTAKQHKSYYSKDGDKLVSVTQALGRMNKPLLMPWANKLGLKGISLQDHLKVLADIGTLAHTLIEELILQETRFDSSLYSPAQFEVAEICLNKFEDWFCENDITDVQTELSLCSETNKYGGTMDLYCNLNGKHTVIDYKTGTGIYLEHKVQGSAYKHLLRENGYQCDQVIILKCGRNANEGMEQVIAPDGEDIFNAFLSSVNAYYAWQKIEGI